MFNEVHSSHGHTLLLITKPSLQATALLQHLKQSLAITGKLHNIQRSLEDISAGCIVLMDMMEALETLFADYLLPWCNTFLGKVEAHAVTPFWRTLAPLTRDAIGAMWDELQEEDEE